MSGFLFSFVLLIITSYISFTDTLALHIQDLWPETNVVAQAQPIALENEEVKKPSTASSALVALSSAYAAIPNILLESKRYQAASVADGIYTNATSAVTDPLKALVNIYCSYRNGNTQGAITGTGFFIHEDGIILTNAHVAQFLLLQGIVNETSCIIRTGSPATPRYQADILYISPAWIIQNAKLIATKTPRGTGERDYALLYVADTLDNSPLPAFFPYLGTDVELLSTEQVDEAITVAGYPAESAFAAGQFKADLVPESASSQVAELMTFGSNYADLFSITGTDLGQQGSSGGPIVDESHNVIGLISTRGDDAQFGTGSLRAITLSYVDRTITQETSSSLEAITNGNIQLRSEIFKETVIPILQSLLRQEL